MRPRKKAANAASISGLCGNAGQANYAAAKSGLVGLTKSLAKEWGRHRVNVNCVAFGLIETRMTRAQEAQGDGQVAGAGAGIPKEALDAIRARAPQLYLDLVGDGAHALHAFMLARGM